MDARKPLKVSFVRFLVLGNLLLAVRQVILTKWEDYTLADGLKINIRLYNHPESMIALKNLKAAYIGNFHFSLQLFFIPQNFIVFQAISSQEHCE